MIAGNVPGSGEDHGNKSRHFIPQPASAVQMVPEVAPTVEAQNGLPAVVEESNETKTELSNVAAHQADPKAPKQTTRKVGSGNGDTAAVLSLVFGAVGFVLLMLGLAIFVELYIPLAFLLSIPAVILGTVSLGKKTSRKAFAILGIVFGGIAFVLGLLLVIYLFSMGGEG